MTIHTFPSTVYSSTVIQVPYYTMHAKCMLHPHMWGGIKRCENVETRFKGALNSLWRVVYMAYQSLAYKADHYSRPIRWCHYCTYISMVTLNGILLQCWLWAWQSLTSTTILDLVSMTYSWNTWDDCLSCSCLANPFCPRLCNRGFHMT